MIHTHAHDHGRQADRGRMAVALAINLAMLAAAIAGGFVFDSLALLADAGHVLADVGAIVLALVAGWMATRAAPARATFGFRRGEILAALVNGVALVVIAVLVLVEGISRLGSPPDVEGAGVLAVGALGLTGNVAATIVLARGDRGDINLEGVLRHSAADALGSLGVIVAGALVLAGWREADAVVSIAIGVLILAGSLRLIREPLGVLMEAAPRGIDIQELGRTMCAVPGVREVHDLHVWTVTSRFPALAAHVRVDHHEDPNAVRERLEAVLHERYGLDHTTLQVVREDLLQLEDLRTPEDPAAGGRA